MTPLLWMALLAGSALAMLAAPFVPAWREWARPTDHGPLRVDADYVNRVDHFARELRESVRAGSYQARPGAPVYAEGDFTLAEGGRLAAVLATGDLVLGPGSEVQQWAHADGTIRMAPRGIALRRMSAGVAIELAPDCTFERLNAPLVTFGSQELAPPARDEADLKDRDLAELHGCRAMAPGWYRVDGHVVLPPGARYRGSLVVTGALSVGERSVIHGDVKARSGVVVGAGASVLGTVACERSIHILRGALVRGPVISESDVVLSAGAVVGTPEAPTTITAENIMVASGARAHGTVWARELGVVWAET